MMGERPIVVVKHHLLRLAQMGPHENIRLRQSRTCATFTSTVTPLSERQAWRAAIGTNAKCSDVRYAAALGEKRK